MRFRDGAVGTGARSLCTRSPLRLRHVSPGEEWQIFLIVVVQHQQASIGLWRPFSLFLTPLCPTMVVYVLYIKADLEGVASLKLKQGANLCISVRNPLDHDQVREKVVIDTSALEPKEHAKHEHHAEAPCHFAMKWDHDEPTRSTIQVLSLSPKNVTPLREMESEDSGTFVPMLALDCQGMEPYAFHPMGDEFVVTNAAAKVFDKVDLSSGDWSDFDLGTGSTTVMNLQGKFE